jgi:hypothetical protein
MGEVGIEITPIIDSRSLESRFAAQLDALLRRACQIARALTSAEQAAPELWVGEESPQARQSGSSAAPVCNARRSGGLLARCVVRRWPQLPPARPVAPARLRRTGRGAVLHD